MDMGRSYIVCIKPWRESLRRPERVTMSAVALTGIDEKAVLRLCQQRSICRMETWICQ